MANPVLVEVTRGNRVESRHRGSVVVVDTEGGTVVEIGDADRPVFPRSCIKAIQALPLVESGAADAFGLGDAELALACASHSGEPAHVSGAAEMLARVGLDETALECGAHWPGSQEAMLELARSGGAPSQLHNNCSGKHAGFLCTCNHLGLAHRGYVDYSHRYQAMLRGTMEEVTGAIHDEGNVGIDGCAIPTYAIPLRALALGFARMGSGLGMGVERMKAARRLLAACMAEPFFMSGTGTMDLALIEAGEGRIFVKTGAEAVYVAALPTLGLGVAVKCDDGGTRASEAIVAEVLAGLFSGDHALSVRLRELARPAVKNRKGVAVGQVRPTEALAAVAS